MKVHYFPAHGRAESIRMILWHAKQPFENVVYQFDDWIKVKFKSKFEFNQLPVLEIDGKYFAQSTSILRMLAIQYGYYSQNFDKCWEIDSAVDFMMDIVEIYGNSVVFEQDEELKQKASVQFFKVQLPYWCDKISHRIQKSTGKYLSGENITMADFTIASFAFSTYTNDNCPLKSNFQDIINNYPNLVTYLNNLQIEFQEYLQNRVQYSM